MNNTNKTYPVTKLFIPVLLAGILPFDAACASNADYTSSSAIDIDNDGHKESFVYSLKKVDGSYLGRMVIKTVNNKTLWEHEFEMTPNDLENDLLVNEGNISMAHWVRHFFDGSLSYGAKFETTRIQPGDIDMEYLGFYSDREKIPVSDLRKQILSQKINATFYYRASWREDLVMLVYLPKLEKFIGYSGGDY